MKAEKIETKSNFFVLLLIPVMCHLLRKQVGVGWRTALWAMPWLRPFW